MKILISCIPFDRGRSGISVYIRNVVAELAARGHELTLLVEPDCQDAFPGLKTVAIPRWACRPLLSLLYHLLILPFRVKRKKFDFCLLTAANRRVFAFYPLFTVAVVHDLSYRHIEAKYDRFRLFCQDRVIPFFLRSAHCVLAISKSTARDLRRYWRIAPEKIRVAYNGLSLPPEDNPAQDWRQRQGLAGKPYILYVSRIESPGKNHLNLIRAFELLPQEISARFRLVFAGADWNGAGAVREAAGRSKLRDRIVFAGFLPGEDLREAYENASCYVFPSLFEGFGLSLIEAMHYGVPCCCSATSSLGEIGQGAALLFEPSDPRAIMEAMARILSDGALRSRLIAEGRRRAREFTWSRHAGNILKLYRRHRDTGGTVFGIRFARCSMEEALKAVDRMIASPRADGTPYHCAFVNAHCLNLVWKDRAYGAVLRQADRVWPDGIGVALAARYLRTPVRANINGTDMLPLLCRRPHSLYLLGAAPGVAEEARLRLQAAFPGLTVAGADHGYFSGPREEREAIDRINAAGPDILLVAMGVPRQELWIAEHRSELNCRIAIGVGGLLDFASGRMPRAPRWMRKAGLEWLYRLYREPRRLGRRYIIGNPLFLLRVLFRGGKEIP